MNKLTFFKKREQETQTLLFGSWLLKFWLRRTKWVHSGRLKKPHLKKKVKSIAGNEKKKIDENLLPLGIYPSTLIERRNAFHRAKFAQRIYLMRMCLREYSSVGKHEFSWPKDLLFESRRGETFPKFAQRIYWMRPCFREYSSCEFLDQKTSCWKGEALSIAPGLHSLFTYENVPQRKDLIEKSVVFLTKDLSPERRNAIHCILFQKKSPMTVKQYFCFCRA